MRIIDNGRNNKINIKHSDSTGLIQVTGNDCHVDYGVLNGAADIMIHGDNGNVILNSVERIGRLKIVVKNGGRVSIGKETTVEECYILADGAEVVIGEDCMISFQVNIRTSDAHGIYDVNSGELLNKNEAIIIGDHVWIGQAAMIAKGSIISRNVVVGAKSLVRNIKVESNTVIAGAPARVIRQQIIWDRNMTDNIFSVDALVDPNLHRFLGLNGPKRYTNNTPAYINRIAQDFLDS